MKTRQVISVDKILIPNIGVAFASLFGLMLDSYNQLQRLGLREINWWPTVIFACLFVFSLYNVSIAIAGTENLKIVPCRYKWKSWTDKDIEEQIRK